MIHLHRGWHLTSTPPGLLSTPDQLPAAGPAWRDAVVPGTVAQSPALGVDEHLDASDWWYRCTFTTPEELRGLPQRLRFEGLATLAEVWLNGVSLFSSRNMFRARSCDVVPLLRDPNELVVCFRSLDAELSRKKPRPRWKTALVDQQNLRWVRTTLLGRMPGWTPRIAPVGPWRPITLSAIPALDVTRLDLRAHAEGADGRLRITADVTTQPGHLLSAATIRVGTAAFPLTVEQGPLHARLSGDFVLQDAPLWWPHTHGEPSLLGCVITLRAPTGDVEFDCGRVGFKSVAMERGQGRVQVEVNGRAIFCRGACWTVEDLRSLDGTAGALEDTLRLARDAGLNMLRIGGTMTYGCDELYRLCDELGILVWQDFMFANMDYPFADETFHAEVSAEVTAQLLRFQRHPCIAVYCGGSEIEQQAAMLGLPAAEWSSPFFSEALPALCASLHPGIPYFPSTPCEGALPFHTAVGITHYYGVGAYRRPLSDARLARVKFTPECLGFSNVPDAEAVERMAGGGAPPLPHHPAWKAGVPRDSGAGWDFEDVRDHYLGTLYNVDPIALRSTDIERYLALSRAVTGEVMLRVFAEWRRPGSGCGGGLVWFLKDLRPGAGWGILDSTGRPKAAWWYLRRAWARRAVLFTDEGLDGLDLHVLNETADVMVATVELEVRRSTGERTGFARAPVRVDPFGALTLSADALLGTFSDLTYAYRFGPPRHDVVIARLRSAGSEALLHEDVFFPRGHNLPVQPGIAVSATSVVTDGTTVVVTLEATAFLQTVSISSAGYQPDDNAFHLSVGNPKALRFTPSGDPPQRARPFKAHVSALNMEGSLTVRAPG
ncbi:MAG: glycoside hydrolase family 2 protein [Pseudomonadota bacterium]|nr:glycoside hydrolase family 2 protein [Pseudomonadota bacterium]